MVGKLLIQQFIADNPKDWETKLKKDPYSLQITRDQGYVIFSYKIDSKFSEPLVHECRGIILREEDWSVVCFPFIKFFNYGEGYAADIDWSSARVQEKLDGSIIKLWWDRDHWWVSTNGVIDARKCPLFNDLSESNRTYYDLFNEAAVECLDYSVLCKDRTYIFELVSPYNRVVVPYKETRIYHIGTRDNRTFQEIDQDIGVPKPQTYSFNSLKEAVEAAKALPFSEEGYVVVDKNWNRVKIKSPAYVSVHHLSNNGRVNKKRILELISINEHKEFLTYFPEYIEHVDKVQVDLENFYKKVEADIEKFFSRNYIDKKSFALDVTKEAVNPGLMFAIYDGKFSKENYKEYFRNLMSPINKMMQFLGYKE